MARSPQQVAVKCLDNGCFSNALLSGGTRAVSGLPLGRKSDKAEESLGSEMR